MNEHNEAGREKLWELIKSMKFGMFTTRHDNGHLHSRPMTTQNKQLDEDNVLWYFMSKSGDPVRDIIDDGSVNVAFADPGKDSYVSVSGHARIIDDAAKKAQLWNTFAQAWFHGGATDPDLALVAVTITHAHYWDVEENQLVQLFEMAKGAITGKTPNMGTEGEVRMR